MNDSQKLLIARVMLQINKAFEHMSIQQQAEVAQTLNQRLERQIISKNNLEEFNSTIANEQRAADMSEAEYKRRKAAYDQEVAAAEAAKTQSTENPVHSTAEQEAVAPTETSTDSDPSTDAQ